MMDNVYGWEQVGNFDIYRLQSGENLAEVSAGSRRWEWALRFEGVEAFGVADELQDAMNDVEYFWSQLSSKVRDDKVKFELDLTYWMAGVAVAHLFRFGLFDDPIGRQIVAGGGVVIYGLAALMSAMGYVKVPGVIVTVFPLIGIFAVLVTGSRIDNWQLAVGITQFAAMLYVLHRLVCEAVERWDRR